MIIRNSERKESIKEHVQNGEGSVIFNEIATNEELYDKTTMYAVLTFKENCGIGVHTHHDEEEVILVLEGKAEYEDDGEKYEAYPGDVLICKDEHSHSIRNVNKEELKIVALKIKK